MANATSFELHTLCSILECEKMKIYQIGRKCCMCNKDRWTDGSKIFTKIFMLTGTVSSCKHICIKDKLIGIGYNDKEICIPCLLLLVGLEDYYDKFYYHLLDNEEAKYILIRIQSDKQLLNKIAKIRAKGNYIPNEVIKDLLSHSKTSEQSSDFAKAEEHNKDLTENQK